ncbi:hypothetical protein [Petroclostridium sp. X23]|uniref:hypothetical protein n=1 Tax=Petroclostridium sp. X23 TaxID=3045146 RepID=UPI0024AD0868|nr:hypothetical protein [Petroclostridium sp. X23]WHH59128.1 hypothetical protein QKW49_25640 [Petroclostridium sp. X23]
MYTRVESQFWQDDKMRSVDCDERFLMLYLLTSPHRNILGLYFLPIPYACFDLGWDEKRFTKALEKLEWINRIKYDHKNHTVLVCNYLKYNPLENPNQVKSAIDKLNELPETPLIQDFKVVIEQFEKEFMEPLKEQLNKRFIQPVTETVTETVSVSGTEDNVCVDTPAENLSEEDNGAQDNGPGKGEYPTEFEEFWSYYPRRVEKKAAFKNWNTLVNNKSSKISPHDLIKASYYYAEECKLKNTAVQYVKHAKTFLGPSKPFEDYINGIAEYPDIEKPKIRSNVQKALDLVKKSEQEELQKNEQGDSDIW